MLGESIFCLHFERRKFFIARLALALVCYFGLSFLIYCLYGLIPVRNAFLTMLLYLVCFVLTMLVQFVCFDVKVKDILFAGTGGYAVQHIGYATRTLIAYFTGIPKNPFAYDMLFSVLPFIIVTGLVYFLLVKPAHNNGELRDKDYGMILLSFVMLLSAIVMNQLSGEGMGSQINRFTTSVICKGYSVICCMMILFMQFGLFRQNKLKHDNALIEQLFKKEREQHELAKETIDMINIKCHDLKHQISALKTMDSTERKKSIEELEKSVLIYDSTAKTGNDALDVVLMEKMLICDKYNIKFSYIIDGAKLSAMSTPDIYSLFGNAIDNAIEQVIKEEDDKRIISLRVRAENNMLFIHMDNYCSNEVAFENGKPITSKQDKAFHGFGIRSIEYITKKYNGDLNMSCANNTFVLNIMLPIN